MYKLLRELFHYENNKSIGYSYIIFCSISIKFVPSDRVSSATQPLNSKTSHKHEASI